VAKLVLGSWGAGWGVGRIQDLLVMGWGHKEAVASITGAGPGGDDGVHSHRGDRDSNAIGGILGSQGGVCSNSHPKKLGGEEAELVHWSIQVVDFVKEAFAQGWKS